VQHEPLGCDMRQQNCNRLSRQAGMLSRQLTHGFAMYLHPHKSPIQASALLTHLPTLASKYDEPLKAPAA